jgi:hypothetical protein
MGTRARDALTHVDELPVSGRAKGYAPGSSEGDGRCRCREDGRGEGKGGHVDVDESKRSPDEVARVCNAEEDGRFGLERRQDDELL